MDEETFTKELRDIKKGPEGETAAFGNIYNEYRGKVFAYAYTLSKSKETAEEIVQEVFLRLWQKREQIDADQNFEAYLRKVTLNHLLNFFKKTSRRKSLQEEVFRNMEFIRNGPDEQLIEKELRKTYTDAIEQLSPQKKIIYRLSRQEELTHEQIAKKLGLSKNTVNNHLVGALKFIRNYIRTNGGLTTLLAMLPFIPPAGK